LETWDEAEKALTEALDEFGKPWKVMLFLGTSGLCLNSWLQICMYAVEILLHASLSCLWHLQSADYRFSRELISLKKLYQ